MPDFPVSSSLIPATASPAKCVVLVPVGNSVEKDCELGFRELERRGYPVWRVYGYSAINQARNQLATNALDQGFDELASVTVQLWTLSEKRPPGVCLQFFA